MSLNVVSTICCLLISCVHRITDSIMRYSTFCFIIFSHAEPHKSSEFVGKLEDTKIRVFPNGEDWVSTNKFIFVYISYSIY